MAHARVKKLKDESVLEISGVINPETLSRHRTVVEQSEEIFEIISYDTRLLIED